MRLSNLRCYDNGGCTADRYTILPPRSAWRTLCDDRALWYALAADEQPFHPQGFGQHTSAMPGRHLGKRVAFADLPADVQRFARLAFENVTP